jgi:DNA-binding protein HU-beta
MNKSELIERIATEADLSKASAGRALEAALAGIAETLHSGNSVVLAGFGTFEVVHREARTGRNPRTGEAIAIEASNVVKFKAGKALKDSV